MKQNEEGKIPKREIDQFIKKTNTRGRDEWSLYKDKEKQTFFQKLFGTKKKSKDDSFIRDYGTLANLLTGEKLKQFRKKNPELFTAFLREYRLANLSVLSGTYLSIALLTIVLVGIASLIILPPLLFYLNQPIIYIIFKTIVYTLIILALTAGFFYFYPNSVMKNKQKNIDTNLPFVIDHMSAISTSGVPPTVMFELIAKTEQYGEISIQFIRIIRYMEVFGHDLITAVKVVASTIPSASFKEFLDGFVTTIETGGELDSYLNQKADEAMIQYRLNREKYIQTISTCADVYTGMMIAAPLFFVASLTLISMLGGTIGGFRVESVILFGIYIAIPILNILFLVFLRISQQEA